MVGSVAGGCSCGDDDGVLPDAGDDIDAAEIDGMPAGTRSGTLAFTQFTVADAEARAVGLAGLSVAAGFDDLTTATVAPAYTDGTEFGCTVFRYQVGTDEEPAAADEGPITVTDFGPYGDFTCAFNAALGDYLCQSADAAATGTVPINGSTAVIQATNMSAVDVTIGGSPDFTTLNPRGMVVSFPDGTWDAAAMNDAHPITDFDSGSPSTFTILNPGIAATSNVEMENDYSTLIGEAPVPANSAGEPFDVLDGAGAFTVAGGGTENGAIDAFDESITPATIDRGVGPGNELVLADDSMDPTDFPFTAADTKVSCASAENGNCENGGVLNALIVSGETTDGTLPAQADDPLGIEMPDPTDEYATFTCVFPSQAGTIPEAAITEILATNPTRIETRVIYASGKILAEVDGDGVNILSGYGLVGYSEPAP